QRRAPYPNGLPLARLERDPLRNSTATRLRAPHPLSHRQDFCREKRPLLLWLVYGHDPRQRRPLSLLPPYVPRLQTTGKCAQRTFCRPVEWPRLHPHAPGTARRFFGGRERSLRSQEVQSSVAAVRRTRTVLPEESLFPRR